jgi:anti-sigma factor RsiW
MKTIDPAELSALLDGELTPERACEVREEVERNPSLKTEFERLRCADADCRARASAAEFTPAVKLPAKHSSSPSASWVFIVVALAALRVFSLMVPTDALGITLNSVAFAGILLWVVLLATRTNREPWTDKHAS